MAGRDFLGSMRSGRRRVLSVWRDSSCFWERRWEKPLPPLNLIVFSERSLYGNFSQGFYLALPYKFTKSFSQLAHDDNAANYLVENIACSAYSLTADCGSVLSDPCAYFLICLLRYLEISLRLLFIYACSCSFSLRSAKRFDKILVRSSI